MKSNIHPIPALKQKFSTANSGNSANSAKSANSPNSTNTRDSLTRCPIVIAGGIILGLTSLFGQASPLPAVFLSALSGFDCVYALAGTLAGLLISGRFSESLNLITVMVALTAFRLFVGWYEKHSQRHARFADIATAILAGAGMFFTTLILADGGASIGGMATGSGLLSAPALGLLTGFGSYALAVSRNCIISGKNLSALRPSGFASLGFTYVLIIAALSGFEVSMVNLGILASSTCAITFSYKFRYSGGAVCGILGAFGIAVIRPEYMGGAVAVCIAAMASALFSRLGKYTQMAGFVLSAGIFVAFTGIDNFTFPEINSLIAGAILFIFVPVELVTKRFRRDSLSSKGKGEAGAEISEIFARRLKLTGEAMGDVGVAIEKTAEILDRAGSREVSWVYNTACGDVCRRCRHNMTCWGSEYDETVKVMSELTSILQKGKFIRPEHIHGGLAYRCGKREQLAGALNFQYREYTSINAANRKIAQMRTILLSQISATQTMMLKMSGEFGEFSELSKFDRALAAITETVLFENGVSEPKAAVTITDDRAAIEAYGRGRLRCEPDRLCDLLSSALRREFDLPEIIHANGEFLMTMFERAAFSIEYGVYQVARKKEKNCGDYFDSFIDKKGFAYIILSDGMGSGGRARIDSAFACGMLIKLLRAGVDINASIEIINNSLLVKSADESFATLDVCRIDLNSGDVELFKAGSAPTYISCNRRVVKANGKGLPVGINNHPVYERQSFTIGNSDLIIMASDGAELSERWLEHELCKSEWGKEDMDAFARTIATAAKFSSDKDREDDISVIAVKLVR